MLKIYTFAHKRPDFLEIQLKSFQKNLEDDFEFIVFNNAIFDINKSDYNNINTWCKDNNIQCIDIENNKILSSKLYSNFWTSNFFLFPFLNSSQAENKFSKEIISSKIL